MHAARVAISSEGFMDDRYAAKTKKRRGAAAEGERLARIGLAEPKVTLRTVADKLGLSVTTVSRALKEGPEVHKETRAKVASLASAMGYRPHRAGLNLRTGRAHAIGLFLPLERFGEINNLASSLVEGVSAYLSTVGYRTVVVPVTKGADALGLITDLVRERSVDGIILKNTTPQDERVKYLLEVGFPFITFGRTELFTPHPHFDVDHGAIGAEAARLLFASGHEAPVLIAPPRNFTFSQQFVRGWRAAHLEAGRNGSAEDVLFSATTPNGGRETVELLLGRRPSLTGAFVASEETALGAASALSAAGRRIGRDFGLITYGGTQLHRFITPPLTAFVRPHFKTGEALAELLFAAIGGADPADLQRVVKAEMIDYGSHRLA
jgi:LacI family transcriptional regulator